MISVALSFLSPGLRVTKHLALWSSDFPPAEHISASDRAGPFNPFSYDYKWTVDLSEALFASRGETLQLSSTARPSPHPEDPLMGLGSS